MPSFGYDLFKLANEISPIILTGGIADDVWGGKLPIITITEPLNFAAGILSGGGPLDLDNFFARFRPVPGGSIIDNQIGEYPFANQSVAANAIISQPLRIAMLMKCPAKGPFGFSVKFITFLALQATLAEHVNLGGLFTIVTPAFIYTDCILLGLRDVTAGSTNQAQETWQFDFLQPLVTLDQAQSALSNLMDRFDRGVKTIDLNWSSTSVPTATPSIIPSAQPLSGGGIISSGVG